MPKNHRPIVDIFLKQDKIFFLLLNHDAFPDTIFPLFEDMNYCSTRNADLSISLSQAVIAGIAPDGGLFFPREIPTVSQDERELFQKMTYSQIAAHLFQKFSGNSFSLQEAEDIASAAYSSSLFDHPAAAPVTKLNNNTFLLELFHGPTGAFKDFALQFLPRVMRLAIQKEKSDDLCILVATSGDTGGAALSGFADVQGTSCIVFFPRGGVSPLQQAQMQCASGKNVLTLEVSGDFDQAQAAMKSLFRSDRFRVEVQQFHTSLSSANSINIGRLLPQVFYSFAAHAQMVASEDITIDETVDICVPTGNFGDIYSAYLAKKMGLPLGKLVCASNANNTSAQLLQTGIFDVRNRKTSQTTSPAMDILRASNLERAIFSASGMDSNRVAKWQDELENEGFFRLDEKTLQNLREDFSGEWVTDDETMQQIHSVFANHEYLLDPHTAVAFSAAEKYRKHSSEGRKMLIFSTAHYGKFGQTVFSALHPDAPLPSVQADILRTLFDRTPIPILPDSFLKVLEKEKIHTKYIPNETLAMEEQILSFLESIKK